MIHFCSQSIFNSNFTNPGNIPVKKLSMFLLILFVCGAFRSIPLAGAESYADLMYRAEKLTEQRYEKSSRAYRICIAELDAIMTSKESLDVKNAKLKKYIRVLEGAPPIHIAAKKSAPPAVPAAKKPPRNVSETKNNTPAKEDCSRILPPEQCHHHKICKCWGRYGYGYR